MKYGIKDKHKNKFMRASYFYMFGRRKSKVTDFL